MRRIIFLFIIALLTSCDPDSETIIGEVISVADGDTFTMKSLTDERIKVRLFGIDAPRGDKILAINHVNCSTICAMEKL